jgi:predicted protein tyrosine phosphatase
MTIEIQVHNRETIVKAVTELPKGNRTMVISITNEQDWPRLPPVKLEEYVMLSFYDNDGPDSCTPCMTRGQAKRVVSTFMACKDKLTHLLINCDAGISRSAGMAEAFSLLVYGKDYYYTCDRIPAPNAWVKRLTLEAGGLAHGYQ